MKIAITATGSELESRVDARFGRCAYFIIVEPDSMEWEAVENPNIALGGGAGIQSAQLMAQKEVKTVLTGNCGPNAFQTFGAAGIQVIVGVSGIAREAVERYKKGEFTATDNPNVQSHFGMGAGENQGGGQAPFYSSPQQNTGQGGVTMGSGRGGGMGGGQGGGMGGGRGGGMGGGQGGGMGGGRGGGMGGGRGGGMGGGRGGGMGGGRGGGMGGGQGGGMGGMQGGFNMPPGGPGMDQPQSGPLTREQELAMLMEQAKGIEAQLNEVNAHIQAVQQQGIKPGLVAWVDSGLCNGCSRCLPVCPEKAIAITDKVAAIDRARCTGCGRCVAECPQNALSLKKA